MHLYDLDCVQFIREKMETPGAFEKTIEEKKDIMRRLTKAVLLVDSLKTILKPVRNSRKVLIQNGLRSSLIFSYTVK